MPLMPSSGWLKYEFLTPPMPILVFGKGGKLEMKVEVPANYFCYQFSVIIKVN